MRFEIVLGLLSSFQIYHQSLSNSLSMLDFGYSDAEFSLISAVFPVGKFIGTIFTIALLRKNYSNRQCLDYSATFLIFGASAMLLPSFVILCLSRLVIGVSVGIAFISAFVALTDFNNCRALYEEEHYLWSFRLERRQQRGLAAFFGTAALFAAATAFANVSVLLHFDTHFMQICIFSFPALFSGLNYFWHRDTVDEQFPALLKAKHKDASSTKVNEIKSFETTFHSTNPFIVSNTVNNPSPGDENSLTAPFAGRTDANALTLAVSLMSINASIGVPIILAFSSTIYRTMGISAGGAQYLSVAFPLIQLGVMLTLQYWTASGNSTVNSEGVVTRFASKRDIVIVGYGVCLICTFLLLLTLGGHTLDAAPATKKIFASIWFTLLAVASAPPCNAGVAIIASELFSNRHALIEGMALSRAFFWVMSSVLCGAFLRVLEASSLFFAFLICFIASGVVYIFLAMRLPDGTLNLDVVESKLCAGYRPAGSTSVIGYSDAKCYH